MYISTRCNANASTLVHHMHVYHQIMYIIKPLVTFNYTGYWLVDGSPENGWLVGYHLILHKWAVQPPAHGKPKTAVC